MLKIADIREKIDDPSILEKYDALVISYGTVQELAGEFICFGTFYKAKDIFRGVKISSFNICVDDRCSDAELSIQFDHGDKTKVFVPTFRIPRDQEFEETLEMYGVNAYMLYESIFVNKIFEFKKVCGVSDCTVKCKCTRSEEHKNDFDIMPNKVDYQLWDELQTLDSEGIMSYNMEHLASRMEKQIQEDTPPDKQLQAKIAGFDARTTMFPCVELPEGVTIDTHTIRLHCVSPIQRKALQVREPDLWTSTQYQKVEGPPEISTSTIVVMPYPAYKTYIITIEPQ